MRVMTAAVGARFLFIAWGLGDAPVLGRRPPGWVALRLLRAEMRGASAGRDAPAVRAPGADGGTGLGRHPR